MDTKGAKIYMGGIIKMDNKLYTIKKNVNNAEL